MTWRWLVRPLHAGEAARLILVLLAGTVLSIAVSRVFYRVVERPFMSRGSRPPAIGQKAVIAAPVSVVPAPRSARRAEAPRRVERTGDATVADQVG